MYSTRQKNLPYRRYERPFIWCKERSSNGAPTQRQLNAHVLNLTKLKNNAVFYWYCGPRYGPSAGEPASDFTRLVHCKGRLGLGHGPGDGRNKFAEYTLQTSSAAGARLGARLRDRRD